MRILLVIFLCIFVNSIFIESKDSVASILGDTRIKTYVYSKSDVFRAVFHHKVQSYIEFPQGERIQEIAIGDSSGWKISPQNNKLYIKPTYIADKTNLLINTNKDRTYLLNIISSDKQNYEEESELAYVIRFYYPPTDPNKLDNVYELKLKEIASNNNDNQPILEENNQPKSYYNTKNAEHFVPPVEQGYVPNNQLPVINNQLPVINNQLPVINNQLPVINNQLNSQVNSNRERNINFRDPVLQKIIERNPETGNFQNLFNFDYSFVGPSDSAITPIKVFDDTKSTFIEFPGNFKPQVFMVNVDGTETQIDYTDVTDNSIEIPRVYWQFSLRDPNSNTLLCIFNEKLDFH